MVRGPLDEGSFKPRKSHEERREERKAERDMKDKYNVLGGAYSKLSDTYDVGRTLGEGGFGKVPRPSCDLFPKALRSQNRTPRSRPRAPGLRGEKEKWRHNNSNRL